MRRLPASLSAEAMRGVWARSRDSKASTAGAAGVDGVRPQSFASQLPEQIDRIRSDVKNNTYRFSKLRIAPILKPSGGYRIIAVPTVRDRFLQRVLLAHLEATPRFDATSTISFGFTKGKTLKLAQQHARELRQAHPWVLQADIVKFFDKIPRHKMKMLIRKDVRSEVIAALLSNAVDCELEDGQGRGSEIALANGVQRGLGLRQGMPVSPLLSNLLLKQFDKALVKRGAHAVRYADDIAIFGDSREDCSETLRYIQICLDDLQLSIPELKEGSKTVLSGPSEAVEFLGVEIRRYPDGYRLCAPTKKLEHINVELKTIASVDRCVREKRNLGQLVRALDSFVVGHRASMQVLDSPDEFLSRLEALKRKHLLALLVNLIGSEAVRRLDHDRRAILGLEPFRN